MRKIQNEVIRQLNEHLVELDEVSRDDDILLSSLEHQCLLLKNMVSKVQKNSYQWYSNEDKEEDDDNMKYSDMKDKSRGEIMDREVKKEYKKVANDFKRNIGDKVKKKNTKKRQNRQDGLNKENYQTNSSDYDSVQDSNPSIRGRIKKMRRFCVDSVFKEK